MATDDSTASATLSTDPDALRAFALARQQALAAASSELQAAKFGLQFRVLEIEKLKVQIARLRRMAFGHSSEWLDQQIGQLELQLEELETGAAEAAGNEVGEPGIEKTPVPVKRSAKPKRAPLPDHLPRETIADYVGQAAWLLAPVAEGIRALYSPRRKSMAMTRRLRCWHPALDAPGPVDCKPSCATIGRSAAPHRRPPATSSAGTARPSIRPDICAALTDRIAAFYEVENTARFTPPEERLSHRAALPELLDGFFTWAETTERKLSAKSALAEALRYAVTRRAALMRFATDARLEADNTIAENAIRDIALGRRNWLFAGSDEAVIARPP